MQGKVVVITGSNTGIGEATAEALATMGATTVMACRNLQKAEAAATAVRAASGSDDVHVVSLDLADLSSVETCASEVLSRWDHLDVLVNNAGGIWSDRQVTAQGFEQTLGVNHIGPFFLTALLLDRLKGADAGRIVNLSSVGHHGAFTGMNWNDLQGEKRYSTLCIQCASVDGEAVVVDGAHLESTALPMLDVGGGEGGIHARNCREWSRVHAIRGRRGATPAPGAPAPGGR